MDTSQQRQVIISLHIIKTKLKFGEAFKSEYIHISVNDIYYFCRIQNLSVMQRMCKGIRNSVLLTHESTFAKHIYH